MSFLELVKNRYSVRDYLNKEIEEEKLHYVLEAARLAPSACNLQPARFLVIKDKNMLQKMYQVYQKDWFKSAPVIIVVLGDHNKSWKRRDLKDHCDIDVAIAIDHITLAACDVGLGTCWVCAFDAKMCSSVLNLPEYLEPVALIPIGYATDKVVMDKKRMDIDEVVKYI